MKKFKFVLLVLFVFLSLAIHGQDKTPKVKVNASSSITSDADLAEVNVRIQVSGSDIEANSKKIQKVISDIEKNLNVYEIKEGSFVKPLIEHTQDRTFSKLSGSKLGGSSSSSGSSSNDHWSSHCIITISVLKIENLGFIQKEISKIEEATITSTKFKVSNEEEVKLNQYKLALLSAKKKGELMTTTLNAKLGVPILIAEVMESKDSKNEAVNIYAKNEKVYDKHSFAKITIAVNVYVEFQLD